MQNIKVAYDYHFALGVGGIGEYSRGLLNGLCKLEDQKYDFFLFYNSFRGNFPTLSNILKKKCRLIKTRFPLPSAIPLRLGFKYKLLYPHLCGRHKIDIFHGTELVGLASRDIHSIVTVHDIFFNIRPELARDPHNKYMRRTFNELNKYSSIIAMSRNTQDDLIKFNIDSKKITVIYRGLNDVFLAFSDINEEERRKKNTLIKKKYNLPENYFLYVGNFVPRKNTPRLIDIFYNYKKLKKIATKLVLVGSAYGEDYSTVKAKINKMGIEKEVLFIGCVKEDELPYIYSNAKIFFFLSLYEGFGVPPLEAMAVGTPTIVADNSSLTELTKGYSFLVNPEDDKQILSTIDRILNDRVYVKEVTAEAKEYVRKFDWNKTAKETLELYKKVSGKT